MKRILSLFSACIVLPLLNANAWHEGGKPVLSTSALQWVSLTWKDAPEALKNYNEGRDVILPENDPLTVRAQFWMSTLDQSLRSQYGTAMAKVPRPIAVIVKDPSANAYVLKQRSCLSLPVEVLSHPAQPGAHTSNTLSRVFLGPKNGAQNDGSLCSHERKDDVRPEDLVAFFSSKLKHCKIEKNGIGLKLRSIPGDAKDCVEGLSPKVFARGIAWNASLNLIFIHSGMFSEFKTDLELIVTLAHELGHYYRSQQLHGRYGFFYELSEKGIPHQPTAVADNEALVSEYEKYQDSLQLGFSGKSALKPSIQHWLVKHSSKLFLASKECAKAKEIYTTPEFKSDVLRFFSDNVLESSGSISNSGEELYLKFEAEALDCMKNLKLHADSNKNQPLIDSFVDSFPEAMISDTQIPKEGSLADLLVTIEKGVTEYIENAEKFLSLIAERKLGLYTDEQEADDMQVELAYRLGYTGKEILEAELAFQMVSEKENRDNNRPGLVLSKPLMADCAKMLNENWKDNPFVGIGELDDDHHSGCFRIYNIHQEIQSHQYRPAARKITAPAHQPSFEELNRQAKKLHAVKTI